MSSIRIIGGTYRSRMIDFSDDRHLRPTPSRVRETLFNWLGQDLSNKICLDLFAGSGILGFEAISRGAKSVVAVDKNKLHTKLIEQNKVLLQITSILEIITQDALTYLASVKRTFDVIFLDPPYDSDLLLQCLEAINKHKLLSKEGLVYVESNKLFSYGDMHQIKQKKAGIVYYSLYKILNKDGEI